MIYSDDLGLCETCNHVYNCCLHKRYNQPVWQCEEFDDSDRVEKDQVINSNAEKMDETEPLNDNLKSRIPYLGLCSNCKNLEYCTYPKPEGSIKCCGEYEYSI